MGAMDLAEQLQFEFISLINMLEVLEVGMKHCDNEDKDCETSSIYIVKTYLKILQNKCDKLLEFLDENKIK